PPSEDRPSAGRRRTSTPYGRSEDAARANSASQRVFDHRRGKGARGSSSASAPNRDPWHLSRKHETREILHSFRVSRDFVCFVAMPPRYRFGKDNLISAAGAARRGF